MCLKVLILISVCYLSVSLGDPVGYFVSNDTGLEDTITPVIKLERFENSIYYIGFILKASWFQAMQFCKYHHMDLVAIESQKENEFLFNQMKSLLGTSTEYWFWTSGTILPKNHWVWMATGKPITYTNWFPNQPDNAGNNEQCLEVRYLPSGGIKWNDNNCEGAQLHIICEASTTKNISEVLSNMCNATKSVPVY